MPAYLVAIARVDHWTEDFQKYADQAADLTTEHGASYVIRGAPETVCEGDLLRDRVMVISQWSSVDAAKAFWESDQYQKKIKPFRDGTGIYDVAIFEAPDAT